MTTAREIAGYLDNLLTTNDVPDYQGALNGLQMDNTQSVSRVAAAVDFSTRAIEGAVKASANFLIVHHGMFWGGLQSFTGAAHRRIRLLIENDIAVYSAHLPLDRHPTFGNNALLCRELGLQPDGEFAWYKGSSIGLRGSANTPTSQIIQAVDAFARRHGGHVVATDAGNQRTTSFWGLCSGAGASSETLREAHQLGIDTLIVGEGPHHTAVEAEELGITVIYAGHYATETLGVEALARHIGETFKLEWSMIAAPTGL